MTLDAARRSRVAQWAFDTRPILGRFHLWLEDVEEECQNGASDPDFAFVGTSLERGLVATIAVTALGTRLFGRYGEGKGADKATLNLVKKEADAQSAYAMSEGLWHLARTLPENHAILVSLGEGLMPKAGETPEMGSNPLLGFGRVYARPQVAKAVETRVHRLINHAGRYTWEAFWRELGEIGITVWGAAVDTLENTSRFARGAETGAMAVLHLFDQPLSVSLPYEGYMGCLALPREVVRAAEDRSILCTYLTPRGQILECIRAAYPGIEPGNVHVWTLGGESRANRIGALWAEWRALGVHVVDDGWVLPGGGRVFTESGTYAPAYRVGPFRDGTGAPHVFLCDGYAASAEAIQASSLDPKLGVSTSMCLFSSRFDLPYDRESRILLLDPESARFDVELDELFETSLDARTTASYRSEIRHARLANMPVGKRLVTIEDFFPNKSWRGLALSSAMSDDPYSGMRGVEEIKDGIYRVTARSVTDRGVRRVSLTFRLLESMKESKRGFSPLLDRFYHGEDYKHRAVRISDSGRIRNELQTWCSEALEFRGENTVHVDFDRVDDAVISLEKKRFLREVLRWYKENHPIWFAWLSLK
jgi:hypothetical protein